MTTQTNRRKGLCGQVPQFACGLFSSLIAASPEASSIIGCMSGPSVFAWEVCVAANDLNGDGHVDLKDYAELQNIGMR